MLRLLDSAGNFRSFCRVKCSSNVFLIVQLMLSLKEILQEEKIVP